MTTNKNNQKVTHKDYGKGKVIGYIHPGNNTTLVRVEFKSGDVRDFFPPNLEKGLLK